MPSHSDNDPPVFVDASSLINFLRINRLDLLIGCWAVLHIVEEVKGEILDADEMAVLESALEAGLIRVYAVTELSDIQLAMKLYDDLGLGKGEAFSFLAAKRENGLLIIDDVTAVKRSVRFVPGVTVHNTKDIMLKAISNGQISVDEADAIKSEWATQHRFALPFGSFADIL